MTIKKAKYNNKELVVAEYCGVYTICAYIDNVVAGTYSTKSLEEAQEVFAKNEYEMYA